MKSYYLERKLGNGKDGRSGGGGSSGKILARVLWMDA